MSSPLPNPFVAASMTAISKLAPQRPVYRIDYAVGRNAVESFVVKGEERKTGVTDNNGMTTPMARHNQQTGLQTSIMLMRDAARGGLARVLNDREAQAFAARAGQLLTDKALADFKAAYNGGSLWILMGLKQGLVDLEAISNDTNAARAIRVLTSMRQPENLDRLGRILATDMFLGNGDRFNNDDDPMNRGGIQNLGNVFFVEKGTGDFKIKGLDVFDPSRNTALMSHTVVRGCERNPGIGDVNYWAGPLLKDPIQLNRVADNALTSLYTELSGVLRKATNPPVPLPQILGYAFTDRHRRLVVEGMQAALVVIKASCKLRLAQMRRGKADTAGLKSRMKLMNWST